MERHLLFNQKGLMAPFLLENEMLKAISKDNLSTIINKMLGGDLPPAVSIQTFMADIASVVCKHCGGEVAPLLGFDDECLIGISTSEPGIWREGRELQPEIKIELKSGQLYAITHKKETVISVCSSDSAAKVLAYELFGVPSSATVSDIQINRVDYTPDPKNTIWNEYDQALANSQGWNVFLSPEMMQLQKHDEQDIFENDQHAALVVKEHALARNLLCRKVINCLIESNSRDVVIYGLKAINDQLDSEIVH